MGAYFTALVPSIIEAGFAAGAAFFATYSQSDAKTAFLAAGAAFFGAFGVHHAADAVSAAKGASPPGDTA